jgi:hypothetical protein
MIALLIQLIVALVIVGLLLWLVQSFLPVPPVIKNIIYVVVIIIVLIYLLRLFGYGHI